MNIFKILQLSFFVLALYSCDNQTSQKRGELTIKVDKYISEIKSQYSIPGISLALIKNGNIIYKQNYGKANIEHNVSVSDSSVFRIYSLTKPIVATAIFQLIEKNSISLDDEIGNYLEDLPIAWEEVKIKNLMRHTSGLPDIKEYELLPENEARANVYKDTINFIQTTKFQYNQTNYWLLLRIIENITGQTLEDFIIKNQFAEVTKREGVYFSTDSRDVEQNRASLYFPFNDGKLQIDNPFRKRYLTGANGLNITLGQFIKWDERFSNDALLSESVRNKMWETVEFTNDKRKWAYGWNKHLLKNHISYGFSGSMVTAYRNFPKDELSVIYLSNGFERWYNVEDVVDHLTQLVFNEIGKEHNN